MKATFRSLLVIGMALTGLTALVAADAPSTFKVSSFTFSRPAGWGWVAAASPMRKAQLKITDPKVTGNAEIVFFHFGPGGGGGKQANIDRWYGQFNGSREEIGAKSEEVKVGNHAVTYVYAEGTFKSGMPGGPTTPVPGYALVGAIIASAEGDVFVKMTGPKELVKPATADFKKMVEGALK